MMNNENYLSLTLDQLLRATREIQYCEDLVPAQWEALRYLARANKYSLTPSMVADFLGTTKGTASQTLRSLESKGYIKRVQSQLDKRVTNVSPTKAGLKKLGADPLGSILKQVDDNDSEENILLLKSLERLLSLMKHHNNGCHFGYCPHCQNFQPNGRTGYCKISKEELADRDMIKICAKFNQSPALLPCKSSAEAE